MVIGQMVTRPLHPEVILLLPMSISYNNLYYVFYTYPIYFYLFSLVQKLQKTLHKKKIHPEFFKEGGRIFILLFLNKITNHLSR